MTTNQDLGVEISQRLRWDGEAIVETFRAALEDANLHTFNAAVGAVWEMELRMLRSSLSGNFREYKEEDSE